MVEWPATVAEVEEEVGYPMAIQLAIQLAAPSKEDWVEGWAISLSTPSRITFLHLFALMRRSKVTYKLIGYCDLAHLSVSVGGFGGGGGTWIGGGGGGGGGYSGGSGGESHGKGGGGGGSYNSGADQVSESGVNVGQGKVVITGPL